MSKMNFNDYGRCMATYNSWQNGVLFDLCEQIGDVERRKDRGMFFGSIHNTLNHILYVDLRILTRKLPRQLFLVQLFNHQTHHRSQITSELHKMGLDYGNTDVPYTPDLPIS